MNRVNTLSCAVLVVCYLNINGVVHAEPDILSRVDAIRAPGPNFSFEISLTSADNQRLKMSVRVKDQVKSLVRYLQPARIAGRTILFVERNMWIYVPGSRRALRISPRQQVLGGVISADIARMVYSLDYKVDRVELLEDESGESRRRLVLSQKSKDVAYSRIDLIVGGEEVRPLRAEFYAANGSRLLKTAFFEGYREVLGQKRPTVLRVVDHMAANVTTTLEYSNYSLDHTPASYFQPAFLKRLR